MIAKRILIGLLAAAVITAPPAGADPVAPVAADAAGESAPSETRKFALLVGCSKYPYLPWKYSLRGPSNDVRLARGLLMTRFGFADEDIVTLVHENPAEGRPRRANIEREFLRLIEEAQAGDSIFILIAAHGSQQPDDDPDNPEDPEVDALDEVVLPEDVPAWNADAPVVKAITDDELRGWITAIRGKGASVLFVADTCHSGSIDRGGPDPDSGVRTRFVPPSILQGEATPLPSAAQSASEERVSTNLPTEGASADQLEAGKELGAGAWVSVYAVPSGLLEQEQRMAPNTSPKDPVYGRLTYALSQVLATTDGPLTYRELGQRLRWHYQRWRWSPACYLQVGDQMLDREVLGKGVWRERSRLILTRRGDGTLRLNSGSLHGVHVGDIYSVQPFDAEATDRGPWYVTVTRADPTASEVVPTNWEETPAAVAADIPAPSRCSQVASGVPDFRLSVSVSAANDEAELVTQAKQLADQLRPLCGSRTSLVRFADEGEAASVEVLFEVDDSGKQSVLLKTQANPSAATPETEGMRSGGGRLPVGENLAARVHEALQQIAKAINLRQMADAPFSGAAELADTRGMSDVSMEVELSIRRSGAGKFKPVESYADIKVYDGDRVRVEVSNHGRLPIDVTVLYIESGFRILSYYPTVRQAARGFDNRIPLGRTVKVAEIGVNDSTTGLEDLVVIATRGHGDRRHFAHLSQSGVQRATRSRGVSSPLQRLLDAAAFGGATRGERVSIEPAGYAMHRVSWTVVPSNDAVN